MISGCADISMAVQAMRVGALDFLEKPISSQTLSVRIREAIDHDVCQHRRSAAKPSWFDTSKDSPHASARCSTSWWLEKLQADRPELGIGEKTVAKHRATVLEKMQVDSVVELVRLFADAHPTYGMDMLVTQCN